ncbi:MAG: response regulator transcription factor [Rikenellaceae bacterium]|nr:response regulator transcription factor [Rikenellaceae bacterium]
MKKKILILDDKESIARILNIYLASEFECIYFDNPIKGIHWLQSGGAPDLIISDIRMPEMRGDEFLSYLKNNELFKSIPVIILSGEDSSSERIRLLSEGADDFIIKPFNPLELKIRVKKILN